MRWMGGLICLAGCLLAAAVPAHCQEIRDGQSLLTAMHDRYMDSWYESVVFKEKAITLNPIEGNKTEVWDEALQLPGKLRINRGAASDGNGFVFVDGTLATFEKGKSTGTRPFVPCTRNRTIGRGRQSNFSGEDSLASNTAGAFLPLVPCEPARRAAFWFPVS